MAKVEIEHKDLLGRVIELGDVVAMCQSNGLYVATVEKINPKMIRVKAIGGRWATNKYSQDLVKLEGPDVTMYLLKNVK